MINKILFYIQFGDGDCYHIILNENKIFYIFNISRNCSGQKGRQKYKARPNRDKIYAQETVWAFRRGAEQSEPHRLLRRRSGYSWPPDRRQPPKENSQRKVISISFHFYLPPVLACCFESHFRVTPQSCSILHSGSPWNSSLSPRLLICQHPVARVLNLRAPFDRIVVLVPEVQLFVLLSRVP